MKVYFNGYIYFTLDGQDYFADVQAEGTLDSYDDPVDINYLYVDSVYMNDEDNTEVETTKEMEDTISENLLYLPVGDDETDSSQWHYDHGEPYSLDDWN